MAGACQWPQHLPPAPFSGSSMCRSFDPFKEWSYIYVFVGHCFILARVKVEISFFFRALTFVKRMLVLWGDFESYSAKCSYSQPPTAHLGRETWMPCSKESRIFAARLVAACCRTKETKLSAFLSQTRCDAVLPGCCLISSAEEWTHSV